MPIWRKEFIMFKIKLHGGKTMEVPEEMYWHTTSHIMAQAVQRLYPGTKITIGPAIEEGFYYDFDSKETFSFTNLKLSKILILKRKGV